MSLLAAATLFIVVPTDAPPTAHERALEQRPVQVAERTPKSIFDVPSPLGDATHLQSTLVCPGSLSTFERQTLTPFDSFGFDVGCGYNSPSAVITLYLTKRSGRSLADDLSGADAALKTRLPDVKPIYGDIPNPAGGPAFSNALYEMSDGSHTGIWVADVSGWTLKFRATYRPSEQKNVVEAMSALTQKAQATAGTHLAMCAAAPKVERNGTEITEKDELMSLSLIGGLTGQAEADDGFKPKIRWCAEEAVADQKAPLLFWRNIESDGKDGPADRLSLMTYDEPPIWNVTANAIASLLGDEKKKNGPTVHDVSLKIDTKTYLFAFYRGRPALGTLAPMVKDVIAGKRNPVSSYDSKTNTVTIPTVSGKNAMPRPWETNQ